MPLYLGRVAYYYRGKIAFIHGYNGFSMLRGRTTLYMGKMAHYIKGNIVFILKQK